MSKKIGIIFGGISFEHEISIVSAIALKDVLKTELIYIFIDKHREFFLIPSNIINSKLFSSGEYKKCAKLTLKNGGFFKKGMFKEELILASYFINLCHGGDGEDGVLASMLEFFGVDFVGPRIEACAVSFNKHFTKMYAKEIGVKSVDYQLLSKNKQNIECQFPVILKPCRLGSSIGVSVVESADEFDFAKDVAMEFDNDVLVEPFISGVREFNLAGTKINGEFVFSNIEEVSKNKFLDFEKKYLDFNRSEKKQLSDVDGDLATKLKSNFAKIYGDIFEGSLIRCDFFVIENEVYLNEINPIPGSMANYLFDDFSNIINKLGNNLPKVKKIQIDYAYVNKIQSAKGK